MSDPMLGITAKTIIDLIRDMPDDEAAALIDEYAKTVASCEALAAVERVYARISVSLETPVRISA